MPLPHGARRAGGGQRRPQFSKDTAPWTKQGAQEKCVTFVHVVITVGIYPPTTTKIPGVARTEFCRQTGRARAGLELLKAAFGR
jgi:hypothetical protein